MSVQAKSENTGGGLKPVAALAGGYLFGAGCVYAVLLAITGSASAAWRFSLIPLGFFSPVVVVFVIAATRGRAEEPGERGQEQRSRDALIAATYVLALIPFWFSAIGFLNGRIALGFVLLLVYAAMAVVPLQRLLRLRARQSQPTPGKH